jgi:transporter family protein
VSGSFRVAALAIGEQEQVRSIGGRLGGHFDSSRGSIRALIGEEQIIDEETQLKPSPEVEEIEEFDLHIPPVAPPLCKWIWVALLCANAYAFYNIFIKKGSASINPMLGAVILQFVAAVMGSVLLGCLMIAGDGMKLHADKEGIMWSIFAGFAVGAAEMLSFFVSGMGVPVTHSIPVIIGGSVLFGAIMGVVLLGEVMMCHGWSGIFMLVTGIVLVATDPGEKVVEGGGGDEDNAPPLLKWIWIALVCANAYALYNIFIKKGSASINPILGGVILQYIAALFGSCLLGFMLLTGKDELECDKWGIIWSICAGFSVGCAEMLSFVVSGMGVQATQSIPTIIGGSVMFGAVLGLIMLGETMMLQGWGGVLLLMIGIGFVATDPGEKVAGH